MALYFLKLGAVGFGGPIALADSMQHDLQEERGWISREELQDGLAIAQTMPGPQAAQLAMWIGFIRHRVLGATLIGFTFILPPLLTVMAVAVLHAQLQGLSQIRALFLWHRPRRDRRHRRGRLEAGQERQSARSAALGDKRPRAPVLIGAGGLVLLMRLPAIGAASLAPRTTLRRGSTGASRGGIAPRVGLTPAALIVRLWIG